MVNLIYLTHPPRMSLELYPPIRERDVVFTRDPKMEKNPAFPLVYEAYSPSWAVSLGVLGAGPGGLVVIGLADSEF